MEEAYARGNFQESARLAQTAFDLNANDTAVGRMLMRSLLVLGEYERVIPVIQHLIETTTDEKERASRWFDLADAYIGAKRPLQKVYETLYEGYSILKRIGFHETEYAIPFWIITARVKRSAEKKGFVYSLKCIENALSITRALVPNYVDDALYYRLFHEQGDCFYMMYKHKNAIESVWKAQQGFLRLKGDQSIDYANSCILLAHIYYTIRNFTTSLTMYDEGLEIYVNVYGNLNARTRAIQSNRQKCKAMLGALVTTPARMKEWSPYHSDQAQCIKCKHYFAVLEGETRYCYSCLQV